MAAFWADELALRVKSAQRIESRSRTVRAYGAPGIATVANVKNESAFNRPVNDRRCTRSVGCRASSPRRRSPRDSKTPRRNPRPWLNHLRGRLPPRGARKRRRARIREPRPTRPARLPSHVILAQFVRRYGASLRLRMYRCVPARSAYRASRSESSICRALASSKFNFTMSQCSSTAGRVDSSE